MEKHIKEYQSTKNKIWTIRFIALIIVALLISTMLWSNWIMLPFIVLAVVEFLMEKSLRAKQKGILEDYKRTIETLPIERYVLKRVTVQRDGVAQMELENGSMFKKEVDVVKSRIKEPLYEERVMPDVVKTGTVFYELFPKAVLFIPYKKTDKVKIETEKKAPE